MVILLSAAAVVAAAVLFLAWVVLQGGFGLIFASMGLAVASMVLLWSAKWIGSSPEAPAPDRPEPLEVDRPPVAPLSDRPDASPATSAPTAADGPPAPALEEPTVDREAAPEPRMGFPIAEYDTLWVSQIVPLVGRLDRQELDVVEAHERGGRNRAAVLSAIDQARDTGAPEPERDGAAAPHAEVEAPPEVDLDPPADPTPPDDPAPPVDSDAGGPSGEADPHDGPSGDSDAHDRDPHPTTDRDAPVLVRSFLGHRRSPVTVRTR